MILWGSIALIVSFVLAWGTKIDLNAGFRCCDFFDKMSVKTSTQLIIPDVFWDLSASVVTSARRDKCFHVIQLLGPKDSLIFLQS